MTVSYKQYEQERKAFFEKHDYDYRVETSQMDEYGRYYKTYMFEDGAVWYEAMSPTFEKVEVEVQLVKVTVEVKMLRTEYWSTETKSKYYYEKF